MDIYFNRIELNAILNEAKTIAKYNDLAIDGVLKKIQKKIKLNDLDIGILLYAPEKYSKTIISEAIKLNEYIFKKEIEFYGVIYTSDFCIETCSYCGDNITSLRKSVPKQPKHFLSIDELKNDLNALLRKWPSLNQVCLLSGDNPKENLDTWINYLNVISSYFKGKIILNKEPLNFLEFKRIKDAFTNHKLQFRVFQETYDSLIYEREHRYYGEVLTNKSVESRFLQKKGILYPPKTDFNFRLMSQERAILAGFDEYGLGILLGLNNNEHNSKFEILALKKHADFLYAKYGLWPATISFPRILPSQGVNYKLPSMVDDDAFLKLLSVTRFAIPYSKIINTCRESAEMRNSARSLINIEDFEARPGPGGNSFSEVIGQMEIVDKRSGREIADEIVSQGFKLI